MKTKFVSLRIAAALASGLSVLPSAGEYLSPYRLNFISPTNELGTNSLTFDFNQWPRNDLAAQAAYPASEDWYVRSAYASAVDAQYGPTPNHYPAPAGVTNQDVTWKRERVLAAAAKFIGTHYQHHHIPGWNPVPPQCPANWPWLEVSLGTNSAGIDCSDFTAFAYNYGLGIQLSTSVTNQAAQTSVVSPDNQSLPVYEAVGPGENLSYSNLVRRLKPGDLLYIRAEETPGTAVSHVIMWLGPCGVATNGETLIIDSHDNSPPVTNSAGAVVPAGVNIRPFRDGSWYFRCFDHAHRILDYVTPYQVQYSTATNDLAFDFTQPPRDDTALQATLPQAAWYADETRDQVGSWGPHPIQYPAPAGLADRDVSWLRERVLITASKFTGYDYQHHHIPDWSPTPPNYPNTEDWPWQPVDGYRNSYGFDCSDFTSFAYNYGLGIKLNSDVQVQAALSSTPGPGGRGQLAIQRISRQPYAVLTNLLVTGDLLYIRSNAASPGISHVILWVGKCGSSTNGDPLIMDSHGNELFDSRGERIPSGVQLRPFQSNSWYYAAFDHANRILTTNLATAPPLALGPVTLSGTHPVLVWSNFPDETYFVEASTNLAAGFQRIASGLPKAPSPINTFTDTNSAGGNVLFYRIGIQQ